MKPDRYLGLDKPTGPRAGENHDRLVFFRYFGGPTYNDQGRETFEALVPDRFKRPAEPDR